MHLCPTQPKTLTENHHFLKTLSEWLHVAQAGLSTLKEKTNNDPSNPFVLYLTDDTKMSSRKTKK